jgi:TetR/AcrR family transcriptional regulator
MARPRAADHFEKRNAILARAADLFAQHGYDRASIAMIAEASGVSKTLVYHYWRDKEELLFDVLAQHLQHLVEVVRAVADPGQPARLRLEMIAVALLDAYRHADAVHRVQIACLSLLSAPRQEALRSLERALVAEVAGTIAEMNPKLGRQRDVLLRDAELALPVAPRRRAAGAAGLCAAGLDDDRGRDAGGAAGFRPGRFQRLSAAGQGTLGRGAPAGGGARRGWKDFAQREDSIRFLFDATVSPVSDKSGGAVSAKLTISSQRQVIPALADRDRSALNRRRAPPRAWLRATPRGGHPAARPPSAGAGSDTWVVVSRRVARRSRHWRGPVPGGAARHLRAR